MNESTFVLWICCGHCGYDVNPSNVTITDIAKATYLSFGVFSAFMTGATILTNTVFLFTLCKNRALQITPNKLLMMLAITDLLQGCTSWPLLLVYTLKMYHVKLDCLLNDVMIVVRYSLCCMAVFCIFMIALSQYLSVAYPFKYRSHVTAERLIKPVLVVSLINFAFDYLCVFQFKGLITITKVIRSCLIGVLLLLMCIMYVHLPIAMNRHRRAVIPLDASTEVKERCKRQKQSIKLAKTALAIILAFIACYSPIVIFTMFLPKRWTYSATFIEIGFNTLAMSNSVVDSFVYLWRVGSIRKAMRALFENCCNGRKDSPLHASKRLKPLERTQTTTLQSPLVNIVVLSDVVVRQGRRVRHASIHQSRVHSEVVESVM